LRPVTASSSARHPESGQPATRTGTGVSTMNVKHRISRRPLAGVVAVAAALAIGGFAVDAGAASAQTVNAQPAVSQNWSGYAVTSQAGQNFSSVSGSWVQPSV